MEKITNRQVYEQGKERANELTKSNKKFIVEEKYELFYITDNAEAILWYEKGLIKTIEAKGYKVINSGDYYEFIKK